MKYRIKYNDPINDKWLWFTPFVIAAFLAVFLVAFLGVNGKWVIEQKKHWWNKWKIIEEYDNAKDAYIKYFKLHYDNCTIFINFYQLLSTKCYCKFLIYGKINSPIESLCDCLQVTQAFRKLRPTRQKEVIHEKIRRDSGGFRDLLSPG